MNDPQAVVAEELPGEVQAASSPAKAPAAGRGRRFAHPAAKVYELKSLLSIAVIVVFVITFVVQAFRVPTESMENTLLVGDFLLADKLQFAAARPATRHLLPYCDIQRGDIVVFRYPLDPSIFFVKRVVGVPGDHIHLRNKVVYVNGKPLAESYAVHRRNDEDSYRDNFPIGGDLHGVDCPLCRQLPRFVSGGEVVVPAGRYFVMGDNRDQSSDSRYWGFVPRNSVMGRPVLIYLSMRGLGLDQDQAGRSSGKLFPSGQRLAHLYHLARWERLFRVVR